MWLRNDRGKMRRRLQRIEVTPLKLKFGDFFCENGELKEDLYGEKEEENGGEDEEVLIQVSL